MNQNKNETFLKTHVLKHLKCISIVIWTRKNNVLTKLVRHTTYSPPLNLIMKAHTIFSALDQNAHKSKSKQLCINKA